MNTALRLLLLEIRQWFMSREQYIDVKLQLGYAIQSEATEDFNRNVLKRS